MSCCGATRRRRTGAAPASAASAWHLGLRHAPQHLFNTMHAKAKKVPKTILYMMRREPPEEGLMCELLWSDPQAPDGRSPSKRGVGVAFGPDVTRRFLEENSLQLLVRSHEARPPLRGAVLDCVNYELEQTDQASPMACGMSLPKALAPADAVADAQLIAQCLLQMGGLQLLVVRHRCAATKHDAF